MPQVRIQSEVISRILIPTYRITSSVQILFPFFIGAFRVASGQMKRRSAWPDNFALPAEIGVAHVRHLSFALEMSTPPFSLNHVATTGLWTLLRCSCHCSLRSSRCFGLALSLLSFSGHLLQCFGERKCLNCCLPLLCFGVSLEVVNGLEMGAELNLAWAYKAMSFLARHTFPLWFCFWKDVSLCWVDLPGGKTYCLVHESVPCHKCTSESFCASKEPHWRVSYYI
jgi:hypothetical protein